MPITVEEDSRGVDLFVTFTGVVTLLDVQEYFTDTIARFEDFAGRRSIIVVDRVTLRGFSLDGFFSLARITSEHEAKLANSRTAVVAGTDLSYGLARMYLGVRNPPYDISVFRSLDKARAWLDAEQPTRSS